MSNATLKYNTTALTKALVRLLFPIQSTILYNICWVLIIVSTTDCMLMAIINCQWQLQIKQTCSQVLKQLSIMLQLGTVF